MPELEENAEQIAFPPVPPDITRKVVSSSGLSNDATDVGDFKGSTVVLPRVTVGGDDGPVGVAGRGGGRVGSSFLALACAGFCC